MPTRSTAAVLVCLAPLLLADTCPPQDPEPRIVATFGDSLTTGTGASPGYAEELPVPPWTVVDEAVAGQCGSGCLFGGGAGSASDIQSDLAALLQDPGVETIVAMWGTNDALQWPLYTVLPDPLAGWRQYVRDEYVAELEASVQHALGLGVNVVVAIPPPIFVDDEPDDVYSPLIRDIRTEVVAALDDEDITIVDLYALLEDDPHLFEDDGIHFNQDGAETVADILRHYIDQQP
jgi:lysophospholipase L1-like esterase